MARQADSRENAKTSRRGSGKRTLFLILAGVLMLLGLAGFFVWLGFYTYVHPIDMNDYVSVVFRGYDETGTGSVVVDEDAFLRDWSGKLRWKDRADRKLGDPAEVLLGEITAGIAGYGDDSSGILKNGDDVRVRWKGRAFGSRIANAEITADSFHTTVEGLRTPETFDAFADLELVCEGLEGEGRAVKAVEHSGLKYRYGLTYTILPNPSDGTLRNGDLVTVSIGDHEKELELIRTYGKKPERMEKEIPVSGLVVYTTFDPFRDVRLIFSGENGAGILKDFENNSPLEAAQKLGFSFEPNQGLRNGDEVVARIVLGPAKREEMARAYGMLPDPMEKHFVVEGLPEKSGPEPGDEPEEGSEDGEEMEKVFGKLDGNVYENAYFNLKCTFPSAFAAYGRGQIPASVIGGLNDLYLEAGRMESIGVRIQKLTEEEQKKSAREILESYSEEIFQTYKANGASLKYSYEEMTFAGETYTCVDISATVFIVVRIRHRIFIRKEGEYAAAVSVMAGSEQKLNQYCALFQRLK